MNTTHRALHRLNTAFVSLLLLYSVAAAGQWHRANALRTPDGKFRYFHYYVPTGLPANPPLVFLLHGGTRSYNTVADSSAGTTEWLSVADDNKFLLIIPNGTNSSTCAGLGTSQNWNDCRVGGPADSCNVDDVTFFAKLIDWADTNYSIDRQRVYSVGASNGGLMSYRLAIELPGRITAVAAFIANMPSPSKCSTPRYPISVFICNGTLDPLMKWNGDCTNGCTMSSPANKAFWTSLDSCDTVGVPIVSYPDLDATDSSTAYSQQYVSTKTGKEVLFFTIVGGGHLDPSIRWKATTLAESYLGKQNHDIEGARRAWDFLSRQTLPTETVRPIKSNRVSAPRQGYRTDKIVDISGRALPGNDLRLIVKTGIYFAVNAKTGVVVPVLHIR